MAIRWDEAAGDSQGLTAAEGRETSPTMGKGALIVGEHRYLLWEIWDETRPRLLWVLLNPSTADGNEDDATFRKCKTFSRTWGYGALEVVNLFALRSRWPKNLYGSSDPIGRENDRHLIAAAKRATQIVVAWGERGIYQQRDREVLALLAQYATQPLQCLGKTRNGSPRHPLYLAGSKSLIPFEARAV